MPELQKITNAPLAKYVSLLCSPPWSEDRFKLWFSGVKEFRVYGLGF